MKRPCHVSTTKTETNVMDRGKLGRSGEGDLEGREGDLEGREGI